MFFGAWTHVSVLVACLRRMQKAAFDVVLRFRARCHNLQLRASSGRSPRQVRCTLHAQVEAVLFE
jgi:hypothetical protein